MKPGPKQTEDPTSSATSPSLPTRPHHVKTSTKGPWAASPSPTPTHFHQPHHPHPLPIHSPPIHPQPPPTSHPLSTHPPTPPRSTHFHHPYPPPPTHLPFTIHSTTHPPPTPHHCGLSLSAVSNSVTPWTVVHQAPLSMEMVQARILEWFAMPSSRGSSQFRNRTGVSCIAGGFFAS